MDDDDKKQTRRHLFIHRIGARSLEFVARPCRGSISISLLPAQPADVLQITVQPQTVERLPACPPTLDVTLDNVQVAGSAPHNFRTGRVVELRVGPTRYAMFYGTESNMLPLMKLYANDRGIAFSATSRYT